MTVDFYANETQFFDHLYPIWRELPDEYGGTFYVSNEVAAKYDKPGLVIGLPTDSLTVVASLGSYNRTTGPVIYMEHGVGNTYSNQHPSYAGSPGKDRVVLFLNQHQITQTKNQATYPNAEHVIIGTPKMDKISIQPDATSRLKIMPPKSRVVCIAFHWDCHVCPETRSAYQYYKDALPMLAGCQQFKLILHGHPRDTEIWKLVSEQYHIPYVADFADVLIQADVYVNDNSSTMYEFAAQDKPVIVLNAPWYRRDVRHGIRFWNYVPGPQVDRVQELKQTILDTLDAQPAWHDKWSDIRTRISNVLYPYRGQATRRAVDAIIAQCDREDSKKLINEIDVK